MIHFTILCASVPFVVVIEGLFVHHLLKKEWELFKMKYNKTYSSFQEERQRLEIYLENRRKVAEHNTLYERGVVSHKIEINMFGDMSIDELPQGTPPRLPPAGSYTHHKHPPAAELPDWVDWRAEGAVTPVKDQTPCGCCWAFSTTGALEGQHFLKTGKLVSLSEQNLLDCSKAGDCTGGHVYMAYDYIVHNRGLDLDSSYPYERKMGSCRYRRDTVGAAVSHYSIVPSGDEAMLRSAVATAGPVSVTICVSDTFHRYSEGVLDDPDCYRRAHAVLVVGYGTEGGQDYWLVKNSWGTSWGEKGYFRMARNRGNQCHVASYAIYPVL